MEQNLIQVKDGQIYLEIEVQYFKDDAYQIAYAPALNISAFALTPEDAERRLDEAIKIFLSELQERKTFTEVLTSLGWEHTPSATQPYSSSLPRTAAPANLVRSRTAHYHVHR